VVWTAGQAQLFGPKGRRGKRSVVRRDNASRRQADARALTVVPSAKQYVRHDRERDEQNQRDHGCGIHIIPMNWATSEEQDHNPQHETHTLHFQHAISLASNLAVMSRVE